MPFTSARSRFISSSFLRIASSCCRHQIPNMRTQRRGGTELSTPEMHLRLPERAPTKQHCAHCIHSLLTCLIICSSWTTCSARQSAVKPTALRRDSSDLRFLRRFTRHLLHVTIVPASDGNRRANTRQMCTCEIGKRFLASACGAPSIVHRHGIMMRGISQRLCHPPISTRDG